MTTATLRARRPGAAQRVPVRNSPLSGGSRSPTLELGRLGVVGKRCEGCDHEGGEDQSFNMSLLGRWRRVTSVAESDRPEACPTGPPCSRPSDLRVCHPRKLRLESLHARTTNWSVVADLSGRPTKAAAPCSALSPGQSRWRCFGVALGAQRGPERGRSSILGGT